MSVNNDNGPEIGTDDLDSVGFESQQLLKDIEREFETLKEQEAAFTSADDSVNEKSSQRKSEWMWNVLGVIVFALIGVLGEKAYRVLSTKKVEIPEHLESLQEEEDRFAEDSSETEKAMYLRNALEAKNVDSNDEVNRMMDEELESYPDVDAENVVHIDTKEKVSEQQVTKPVTPTKALEADDSFAKEASSPRVDKKVRVVNLANDTKPVSMKQEATKPKLVKKTKSIKKAKSVVARVSKVKTKKTRKLVVKPKKEAKPKFMRYMVVQEGSVLRRGPKSSYESVKKVPTGTTFLAEGYDKLWVKVDFGQYIEKSRLYNLDSTNTKSFKTVWINTKKLNVRARATTQSKVLSTLVKADEVKALKVSEKWSAIKGGGFVYSKYLSKEKVYPFDLPVVMSVDVRRANIREMPSTSSEVVGQYFKGKPLKVHSITDGWAKVGKYQYISVSLLKVMEAGKMNIAKRKVRKN